MSDEKRVVSNIVTYKLTSPTLIWFGSLYFFALLSMIINNLFRSGFSWNSIKTAPEYYASLFLNYGLNAEGTYNSPWQYGGMAWLIAPFLAVFLGLELYFLRNSGFAYNANTRYMDPYLPAGDPLYAFFNKDVYGAGELFFGIKGNMFYISIVWLPIIFASIVTTMYSRRSKRESWIITKFFFNFLIALWLGIQMAKVTDPNLSFSLQGFFDTLFVHRKLNTFVVYEGQYNPMMLTFVFTLFQMVPVLVSALLDGSITTYHVAREQYILYQKRKEYLQERKLEGIDKLPWEDEHEDEESDSLIKNVR